MFGTTREYLDYFNLKKLDDMPPLAELAELEPMGVQLELESGKDLPENPDAAEGEPQVAAGSEALADEDTDAPDEIAQGEVPAEQFNDLSFDDDDDEDIELSDEELAAATAKIEEITAELNSKRNKHEEAEADVPPGGVTPLVGLNAPGEKPPEPATVASLDEARAAAADKQETVGKEESPDPEQSAEVVPLKTS
jgi:segregation and condensation protein B